MAGKNEKWTPERVAKLVKNPGDRSKVPTEFLPAKYKQMRERNRWTPEKVAAAVKNPGTRANVPAGLLPENLRRQREQNVRFAQPLVEGSSLTYGDVARRRKADETLQFGADPVGRAQANERTTASWFDQYQRDLEQHRQRVEGYGQSANAQAQSLAAQAGQVSAPAGMSSENQQVAANAAAVRGQLAGGQGIELAERGRAANTLASLMQASGSGSKAQALGQARRNTEDVRSKLGAFRTKYMADARDSESKNVLAVQLATGKLAASAAEGAADRAAKAAENKADRAADAGKVNQYGYTNAQWSKMTPEQRRQAAADWKKATTGSRGGSGGATREAQNRLLNNASSAAAAVADLRKKGYTRAEAQRLLQTGRASQTVNGTKIPAISKVEDSVALRVALDREYDGSLSAATVRLLHDRGFRVAGLGKTATQLGSRASQLRGRKHDAQAGRVNRRRGAGALGAVGALGEQLQNMGQEEK